jgi:hypothetical protein
MNLINKIWGRTQQIFFAVFKPKRLKYPRLEKNIVRINPLSEEEIRVLLNFSPWEEFQRKVLEQCEQLSWVDGNRYTGRTTRLMVQALSLASEGHSVLFVVKNKFEEPTVRTKIVTYAKELNIEQRIRITNMDRVGRIVKKDNPKNPKWIVIYDHYALGVD